MANVSPEVRAVMMAATAPLIEEAESIVARVAKDIERYREIEARLNGAEAFLGEKLTSLPPLSWTGESASPVRTTQPLNSPADKPPSWKEVVLKLLEGTERGFSGSDLMKRAPEFGLEEYATRYRRNANAFLYGVKRLEDDGLIVRSKGRIYLADVWRRIETGELQEHEDAKRPLGGLGGVVLRIVQDNGPMTASAIIAAYRRRAGLQGADPNPIYRILSKLHPRGLLVKDGAIYRLPSQSPPVAENVTLFPTAKGSEGATM